jgi:hypothetical protein
VLSLNPPVRLIKVETSKPIGATSLPTRVSVVLLHWHPVGDANVAGATITRVGKLVATLNLMSNYLVAAQ